MDAELLALLEEQLDMDVDDLVALRMASPSIFKSLTGSLGIDSGALDALLDRLLTGR